MLTLMLSEERWLSVELLGLPKLKAKQSDNHLPSPLSWWAKVWVIKLLPW